MRAKLVAITLIVLLTLVLSAAAGSAQEPEPAAPQEAQAPLGSAFTYQGQLLIEGVPANASYDFEFRLFNAAGGSTQVGGPVAVNNLAVRNGLFTVQLDFGAAVFNGEARWLEIRMREGSSGGGFTILTPRQRLAPTPYALWSREADRLDGLEAAAFAAAAHQHNAADITSGTLADGRFSAYGDLQAEGRLSNDDPDDLLTRAQGDGRYWRLAGNDGTSAASFLGTTDNVTLTLKVSDTVALRLVPAAGTPNLIGGAVHNRVTAGVVGATIAGGGADLATNRVTDDYGAVGGGANNQAGDDAGSSTDSAYATVAGGTFNTASGETATVGGGRGNSASGDFATVAGGYLNSATGNRATTGGGNTNHATADYATVAGGILNDAIANAATVSGGEDNFADGGYATIGGGYDNRAQGGYATVVGGFGNLASGGAATVAGGGNNFAGGDYSFAAGLQAKANSSGCFVWSDTTGTDLSCGTQNRFIARASGGFYFYTSGDLSTGARLSAGSGTWQNLSDRAAKAHLAAVNPAEILQGVLDLPVQRWSYSKQDPSIRHIGPMAQDFYAAFGVGEDERHISTVDADGVALAAIQGLHQLVEEKDARITALEQETQSQQAQIEALEARLDALEQAAGGSAISTLRSRALWAPLLIAVGLVALRGRSRGQADQR